MIATYLLLNYPEKELLNWRNMQALLGKTGKEGLKRQVTSLDPLHVDMAKADYAFDKYLKETDLETIRDTSAGAATFYVWVSLALNLLNIKSLRKCSLVPQLIVPYCMRSLDETSDSQKFCCRID